ncbi:MAG: hypothetical protein R3C12_21400 [Planctomycetaceae bacterium]
MSKLFSVLATAKNPTVHLCAALAVDQTTQGVPISATGRDASIRVRIVAQFVKPQLNFQPVGFIDDRFVRVFNDQPVFGVILQHCGFPTPGLLRSGFTATSGNRFSILQTVEFAFTSLIPLKIARIDSVLQNRPDGAFAPLSATR